MSDAGLRCLLEAYSSGSMRAASDRLNVAASSISRQIAHLEESYGLPLIEKGRRGIRLTQAGEAVIAHYRKQLIDQETLRAELDELRSARSGKVTLAIGEGFLGATFVQLLSDFMLGHPQIRLEVAVNSSQEITRMVSDYEAHIGLVFQAPQDLKINIRSAITQPLMAIMSAQHRLAKAPSVTLADLTQSSLCLAPRHFKLRQIIAVAESHNTTYLEAAVTTNSIFVMREMVHDGSTVAILPEYSVWTELQTGSLVSVPIADSAMEDTTLALILRAGRQLEGAPVRLLKVIETQLRVWSRSWHQAHG